MDQIISRLIMVTPFSAAIVELQEQDQVLLLQGCALCQITRDLQNHSLKAKPEWRTCKEALNVPVSVVTIDKASNRVLVAINKKAPAVCAETTEREIVLLLDESALKRCRGNVSDFRGRLLYRAKLLGLQMPVPDSSAKP